jgi:phosphate transport system substrate-binding protein
VKNSAYSLLLLLGAVLSVSSCGNSSAGKTGLSAADTFTIWADSSLRVLMNEQRKSFSNIYTKPQLEFQYYNEADIIKALMSNAVSTAVLRRKLSAAESDFLSKKEDFTPKQYIIAYDAYVLIAGKSNPRQDISLKELTDYFSGKGSSGFTLSVAHNASQTLRFLNDRFNAQLKHKSPLYAAGSLNELLDYVRNSPGGLAVIPFSYISDIEAETTIALLDKIKVLPFRIADSARVQRLVFPSQETIATKEYPLLTPIVLVNCNMEKKSGTNFVNFLYKPKAQRLILKCGLCPAIFPGREVNINTK